MAYRDEVQRLVPPSPEGLSGRSVAAFRFCVACVGLKGKLLKDSWGYNERGICPEAISDYLYRINHLLVTKGMVEQDVRINGY